MKQYKLVYKEKARHDIASTYFYISDTLYAEAAAKRWLGRIQKAIHSICENPTSYRLCDEPQYAKYEIRKLIVRRHLILYTVSEDTIVIRRVVDGRRDLTQIKP